MVRASISINLGGILRRSDPLGWIYGWISSGDLLDSVTQVPYLEELYIERNTEKLKLARTVLKHHKKRKVYTQGKSILLFFPLFFWTILNNCYISIQTLIITLLCNVMLTVPRELGLPVVAFQCSVFLACDSSFILVCLKFCSGNLDFLCLNRITDIRLIKIPVVLWNQLECVLFI